MDSEIKILIIEDKKNLLNVMAKTLKKIGYLVCTVNDGGKALQAIIDEKPEMIVLDIQLPNMSGLEILKEIKSKKVTKNIYVIMNSVYGKPSEINQAYELGADAYVCKPSFKETLLKEIEIGKKKITKTSNKV